MSEPISEPLIRAQQMAGDGSHESWCGLFAIPARTCDCRLGLIRDLAAELTQAREHHDDHHEQPTRCEYDDGKYLHGGLSICVSCRVALERRAEAAEAELARVREAWIREDYEIRQLLGRALGYPRFADDQKNFPGATDEDGVAVGNHVRVTLAAQIARRHERLRELAEACVNEHNPQGWTQKQALYRLEKYLREWLTQENNDE